MQTKPKILRTKIRTARTPPQKPALGKTQILKRKRMVKRVKKDLKKVLKKVKMRKAKATSNPETGMPERTEPQPKARCLETDLVLIQAKPGSTA